MDWDAPVLVVVALHERVVAGPFAPIHGLLRLGILV